jgi:hypothetical protein
VKDKDLSEKKEGWEKQQPHEIHAFDEEHLPMLFHVS